MKKGVRRRGGVAEGEGKRGRSPMEGANGREGGILITTTL